MKKRRDIYLTDKNYIINTDNMLFLAGFLFSVFWYLMDLKNIATGFMVIPTLLTHKFLVEVIPVCTIFGFSFNLFIKVMINGFLWGYGFFYIGKSRDLVRFLFSFLLILVAFNLFVVIPSLLDFFT